MDISAPADLKKSYCVFHVAAFIVAIEFKCIHTDVTNVFSNSLTLSQNSEKKIILVNHISSINTTSESNVLQTIQNGVKILRLMVLFLFFIDACAHMCTRRSKCCTCMCECQTQQATSLPAVCLLRFKNSIRSLTDGREVKISLCQETKLKETFKLQVRA